MGSRDTRNLEIPPGGRESAELMINYVSDRSAALLLSTSPGTLSIGSATCLCIGGRYLLATAAHNIDDIRDDSGIRVLPRGRNDHPGIPILSRSHPGDEAFGHDVAWLELEADGVLSSDLKCFGLEDLKCYQSHAPTMPFLLQGYPAAEVEVNGNTISPLSLGLMTISLEPGGGEVFAVEYPPQSKEDIGLELTHPEGISGGGIWLESRFQDELIWAPVQSTLVAIATTWEESAARLSGVGIEHWLGLVAQDFPDLRQLIALTLRGSSDEAAANPADRADV